jgi:NhaA family Na+:H+ antiporter
LGLVLGKLVGVFGTVWLLVRLGAARLPEGAGWSHILGVACLAGIGFTMSLFIGGLSFADMHLSNQVRLGVLGGSAIAAVLGYAVLMTAPREGAVAAKAEVAEAA